MFSWQGQISSQSCKTTLASWPQRCPCRRVHVCVCYCSVLSDPWPLHPPVPASCVSLHSDCPNRPHLCVVNSSPVYINLSTRLSRLPQWTIIVICRYQYFLPVVPDCEWAQCLCTLIWTKSIIVVIGSLKVFRCAGSCHTHTRSECKHWLEMGKNKTNNPSSWINVSVVQVTLQESHVYRRNIHSSIKLLLSAAYICFYF